MGQRRHQIVISGGEDRRVPVRLIVIAKAPMPGRSKTRLTPPCSPEQAAGLAEAALADTLAAVAATPCRGRTIALEGPVGPWLPAGFEVVAQPGGGLGERLASAFSHADGPALLIGMDTPQVCPELLEAAALSLMAPGTDAVLGPAQDGGYWAIGFRRPVPGAFDGVRMSSDHTLGDQRARLRELGLRVAELATLRDVDDLGDAQAVAAECPDGRFGAAVHALEPRLVPEPIR
jgi:rSAM/selenodomain-associated transferase 1